MNTAQLNRRQAVQLVETVLALGLRHAVISPGARNTPLVLALHDAAESGRAIQLHSVIDERAAGFFALGIARRTDTPVLLSCTSGSAAANYFPAIVEASEGQVPLLVVTADRPEELQDCGAPQAMPQEALYGQHVRYAVSLNAPGDSDAVEEVARAALAAWQAAAGPAPGPVHINMRFRKPLWSPEPHDFTPVVVDMPKAARQALAPEDMVRFVDDVRGKRGVLVVGTDASQRLDSGALLRLARCLGWPILTDPVNDLRFGGEGPIVRHHDVMLRSSRFCADFEPDLAIVVGGTTSSRPLENLLRSTPTIAINGSGRNWNPWGTVEWTIEADLSAIVSACEGRTKPVPDCWTAGWMSACGAAERAISDACEHELWEGSVAHQLVRQLPENTLLRIASSMPIRDVDSFAVSNGTSIRVSSNRGVNGIDGTIATSFGEAVAHDGPVAVLMGDLSFVHDAAALLTAPQPSRPTVLIVVNNGGGGIFSFLPMKDHPTGFEPWYVTPHTHDIKAISEAAGVEVAEPTSIESYVSALSKALSSAGVSILHVRVDREFSRQKHIEAWSTICQAVEATL